MMRQICWRLTPYILAKRVGPMIPNVARSRMAETVSAESFVCIRRATREPWIIFQDVPWTMWWIVVWDTPYRCANRFWVVLPVA